MQDPPVPNHSSGWSFTQGFLLGQLSIVILIGFFIKFFIFGEAPSTDSSLSSRQRRSLSSSGTRPVSVTNAGVTSNHVKKVSSVIRHSPPLTTAAILAKTYYNVNGHQPESVDWFNVLIAQTIAQLRVDAQQDNAILSSLTTALNGPQMPDFLDEIRVTEINLGEEFPIFSNCRVIPVDSDNPESGRLQARMDVDLSDTITLGIETKLLLNYPKPFVAVLPVALAVSVVRFSGTLSISFIPSPAPPYSSAPPSPTSARKESTTSAAAAADPTPPTTLTFSFLPDYRLELSTHSLLGSRSRLQDVPKIGQLIDARLHAWFDERCVEPRFQQVVLPSLWPRRKNTRGGDAEADAEDRENGNTISSKNSPRIKPDTPRRSQLPTAPPPVMQPLVSTAIGDDLEDPPDPTSFTSGREMAEHLKRPDRPSALRERTRSYRVPGSMPL